MTKPQKQKALLALLLLVFLVMAGRQLGSVLTWGASPGRSSGTRFSAGPEDDWRASLPSVEELQIEALSVEAESYSEGRDPFQLGRPPAPPPQPRPSESDLRRRIEEARQRRTTEVVEPARPPAPLPPAIDVVYLGSFGSGRMRLAVFTDGAEIFNVPEGQTLKKKFVVVKIGVESADLGFVGFPDAPAKRLEIGG